MIPSEPLEGRTLMSAATALPLTPTIPIPPPLPLPLGRISGVKYNDLNANGVRDIGEPGLANWRIYLDANNNGVLNAGERNTLTNATGAYSFSLLAPGVYHVREVQQLLGPDWWAYGLEANRKVLETFLGYHFEQGLSKRRLVRCLSSPPGRSTA